MNKSRSKTHFLSLTLWLFLLGMSSPLTAQTTFDVTVGDNFFSPSNLTIQVGDTVRWTNASGGNNHNVTANDGSFASQTASSFTYTQTFNSAGTVSYRCTIHPSQMKGNITVQSGGGGGGPPPADLTLLSVDAPEGTFAPGDGISIDISIKNIGGETSPSASITYYASTNSGISANDIELGTDTVTALAVNTTRTYTADATLPANIDDGTYFIGAIIEITDASSTNNINVDNVSITVAEATGEDFTINDGLNDAWFNPATPGQGFFITVFPDIQMMFLAWFTFDTQRPPSDVSAILGEPGHRWLTAFGPYSGDTATLDIEVTQGGVFDTAEPAVSQSADGTIEVIFSGCNAGVVDYEITSAAVNGQVPIERIALDNVPFCEAQIAVQ